MLVGILGIVMCANSLIESFFFDGGCSWKVTGPKKEVVVVEMVVGEGVGVGSGEGLRGWFELIWGCCCR